MSDSNNINTNHLHLLHSTPSTFGQSNHLILDQTRHQKLPPPAPQQHQQQQLQLQQQLKPSSYNYTNRSQASEFTKYDLKSKDSKYKRWTPKMDQYLVKLLSDVVRSFPQGSETEMTKKSWNYICGQLRSVNPETVYSTYTKYSCQQHLCNVIHYRYKIWYRLMTYSKLINQKVNNNSKDQCSYKWNPKIGRFQILDLNTNFVIVDERNIKTILYSESLDLPDLTNLTKSNLIINDFFLSDNLKYMSLYHNEILPLLIKMDPSKYLEDLGNDIYKEIPKFNYPEANREYNGENETHLHKRQKLNNKLSQTVHEQQSIQMNFDDFHRLLDNHELPLDDESVVDPLLKDKHDSSNKNLNFSDELTTATITAMNMPSVINPKTNVPYYIKDKKWFNRLIQLHSNRHITSAEVLSVCEGIRDEKIPLFMLNILDHDYYGNKHDQVEEVNDALITKRIKEFMLPMVYNN